MTEATYVVDVCHTLFDEDTTLGLLRCHFTRTRRPLRRVFITMLSARTSPLRAALIVLERLGRRPLAKHLAVGLLSGDQASALGESAQSYAQTLLSDHRVPQVWEIFSQRAAKSRVILASASLDPIIAALAREIGADHVASTLEERGGRLTGRYAHDVTGRKREAIEARCGSEALSGRWIAISDNLSDAALLSGATQGYAVIRKPAHRERWAGFRGEIVEACR
ncbi:haloacid dehalogenase-like hydrolase [Novosphingobium naphthalenivorans]|uniref:haloacid dehalogenase-like hydrolase n=1 Tax=Novosphingobium naphthalenivorans TaxID=273168 RepID=UPI00082CC761|nr:haloacid dehalogenase-like hydrolase [Novosphingobium naphthalenivorans]